MSAAEQVIPINPAMLRWAREDAGFSLVEAALQAKISGVRGSKTRGAQEPAERLHMLEEGTLGITRTWLGNLAKLYRRPEVFFFLSKPPRKENLLADFRTLGSQRQQRDSPAFAALQRRIANIHRSLKELAEDEGKPPLPFVRSVTVAMTAMDIAAKIRAVMGPDMRWGRKHWDERDFFKALREQAHAAGIFVVLIGNLGSHHSSIPVEIFRGIAIADPVVPLIVINPNDSKAARIFTLTHEICHIFLGMSGISNSGFVIENPYNKREELLCNAVAAEFLVPAEKLRMENLGAKTIVEFDALSRRYGVSTAVLARRAYDLSLINKERYDTIFRVSMARRPSMSEGSPSPNAIAKSYLGDKLLSTLVGAAQDGRIDISDAAYLLNLSAVRIEKVCR